MKLPAARLRDRCRVEYKATTPDATYGTEVITWTALATLWCEWQDALPSKDESIKQGLVVATRRARVRLRYRTDIDATMRLVLIRGASETAYQIVGGPAVLGNREGIELMVEAYSS